MALTTPFAQNGDKKAIPQNTSDGSVSFDRGFGSFYALPPEEGGLFIDRAQFNQLMYDTTSQVLENKTAIATQANRINEVNTNLTQSINTKANQATTYTKTEVNNLLNAKANSNAVVALSGNQTIAGVKTLSGATTFNGAITSKGDNTFSGNNTFNTGQVTFNNKAPISSVAPTVANHLATKAYIDGINTTLTRSINTKANANATVNLTGNQTIAGVKTFSSPVVVPNATDNTHAVNLAQLNTKANQATTYTKTEVDTRVNAKANANATVNLTGNQTIAGIKTFSAVPVCNLAPTANNHLVNKAYIDSINQVPDYSKAISITPNKSFTAQFNGVVEIYADFNATGGVSVSLGASLDRSKNILGCASGIASGIFFGGQAIIVKGQQYYFSALVTNLYRAIIAPFKSVTQATNITTRGYRVR